MKKQIYMVEVGVLLEETDKDFDYYRCLDNIPEYSHFSFYDENLLFFTDKEEAIEYAKDYIFNGVKRTYGYVVEYGIYNIDEQQEKEIEEYRSCDDFEWLHPKSKNDIIFFDYKK